VSSNCIRAITLANSLSDGSLDPSNLSDNDWYLLLLAAGLNEAEAGPATLSRLILDAARHRTGYFRPRDDARLHQVAA
jgi:hypothetical protein